MRKTTLLLFATMPATVLPTVGAQARTTDNQNTAEREIFTNGKRNLSTY